MKTRLAARGPAPVASCSMSSRAPAEREQLPRAGPGRGRDPRRPPSAPSSGVAPVAVAAHIRGVAIVTDDGRVRTMVNQGFAAPLHTLVEEAVTDRLRAAGRYGAVLAPGHPSAAPFACASRCGRSRSSSPTPGTSRGSCSTGSIERENDRGDRPGVPGQPPTARPKGPERGGFVRGLEDALNAAIDVLLQELETPPGSAASRRSSSPRPSRARSPGPAGRGSRHGARPVLRPEQDRPHAGRRPGRGDPPPRPPPPRVRAPRRHRALRPARRRTRSGTTTCGRTRSGCAATFRATRSSPAR